jgi:hypothetical protein
MALPNNRKAVLEILDVLEPKLLGNMIGGYVAVEIIPGGDLSAGSESYWDTWHILVRKGKPGQEEYEQKQLSSFPAIISVKELDALFAGKFRSTREISAEASLYDPPMEDGLRARMGAACIVAIADNSRRISFRFSWGKEQDAAGVVDAISRRYSGTHSGSDHGFVQVMDALKSISPDVYKGGPDPEYSFESHWLTDYERALKIAAAANQMTITGVGSSLTASGNYKISATITFFK